MLSLKEVSDYYRQYGDLGAAEAVDAAEAEIGRLRVANAKLSAALERICQLQESELAGARSVAFAAKDIARRAIYPKQTQ